MNRTTLHLATRRDRGYILVAMMALTMALLGTGIAFMQWATDESIQGGQAHSSMQAYYVAQAGVIERGLTWMYQQQAGLMPQTIINLSDGTVAGVGRYKNVKVTPVFGSIDNNSLFSFDQKYKIEAVGIVNAPWEEGEVRPDTAKAILYVQVRSFVDYMYLTNWETSATFPGDIVRFFGRDTLWGRVHSNDWIATQNAQGGIPTFWGIVSTTKPDFRSGSPNPAGHFNGGAPHFNAPPVLLPEVAESIRSGAVYYNFPGEEYYMSIRGASATVYHWPEGTELDTLNCQNFSFTINENTCVFFDGRLRMRGVLSAEGKNMTVGCSQDIRLIDNVMIEGTNTTNGLLPPNATSILGIVSEQWIYIANTWENGRENRTGTPPNNNRDIVITAALIALRGSFQLEQMNDVNDPYISPTTPDERGNIVLTGSITQWRRGYVHRSNRGGTGYNKVYHYDDRFGYRRPPCFMGATDADGRVLLNMVQWGQASEDPVDVAAQRRVRYN